LLKRIAYLAVRSFQSNDPKIKIQIQKSHGLPTPFLFIFIYKKRDERRREKEEKKRRYHIKEIKTEIRPSQLQTTITFDRKLRLRRSMRPRKAYDEIYRVNRYCFYRHF
jgi:hypothetical protein